MGCPNIVDLIQDLAPSVVSISIERNVVQKSSAEPPPLFRSGPGGRDEGSSGRDRFQLDSIGSGFFCDRNGHIVTNAHVVENATKILVTLSTGKVCRAVFVGKHPRVDLALIKIKPPFPLRRVRIGDSGKVRVGEWVFAMGNPFGLGRTVTLGIVSGKGRFIGLGPDDDFIQTDASINPGNSGGPLFNLAGEVIGVNTAIIASGKGIGFSIPAGYVRELIRSRGRMKTPSRAWLGIHVDDVTEALSGKLGMASPRGIVVEKVIRDSPAFHAGMKKGDLIVDAAGRRIRDGRHLSEIVATAKPGDQITMTVLRGKRMRTLYVIVGKSPEL
jgi:serine protease Do